MPKISDIQETPNPNAVKFILREPVSHGTSHSFKSTEDAEGDALALTRDYTAEDPLNFVGQHLGSDTLFVADAPFAVHPCKELMNIDYSVEGE